MESKSIEIRAELIRRRAAGRKRGPARGRKGTELYPERSQHKPIPKPENRSIKPRSDPTLAMPSQSYPQPQSAFRDRNAYTSPGEGRTFQPILLCKCQSLVLKRLFSPFRCETAYKFFRDRLDCFQQIFDPSRGPVLKTITCMVASNKQGDWKPAAKLYGGLRWAD